MPALYVNLMPKYQHLGYQRSSRPEQPDQRRPNKAARFPHRTEALRDSASAVSPIRFTTGTAVVRMESEQNSSTLRHYLNLYVRISGGPLDHSRMLGQLDPNRTLSVGSDDEAARLHQVCRFCGCVAITVHQFV